MFKFTSSSFILFMPYTYWNPRNCNIASGRKLTPFTNGPFSHLTQLIRRILIGLDLGKRVVVVVVVVVVVGFNVFLQVEHANFVLNIEKNRNRYAKSLVSNVRLDFSQMTPKLTKSFLSPLPTRHL